MKGNLCPEASAFPEPERVGRKVRSRTNKSSPPSLAEAGQKRWGWRKNPRFFRAGRFRMEAAHGGKGTPGGVSRDEARSGNDAQCRLFEAWRKNCSRSSVSR